MRQDHERQLRLEPKRINQSVENLTALGLEILQRDSTKVVFLFNGNKIQFFPYSGWHSGKGINDGRGWENLKKQIEK